jgi:hypothetical protein
MAPQWKKVAAVHRTAEGADIRWRSDSDMISSTIPTRSQDAVIRVYDEAGNVIETHEHNGDFKEWWSLWDQIHRELVYRALQFLKRSQLFIGANDETLSVTAMRASNEDLSPFGIHHLRYSPNSYPP